LKVSGNPLPFDSTLLLDEGRARTPSAMRQDVQSPLIGVIAADPFFLMDGVSRCKIKPVFSPPPRQLYAESFSFLS